MSDREVKAMRREWRKCEEGVKVISMTANGMRIKNLVGKDYKLYDKKYIFAAYYGSRIAIQVDPFVCEGEDTLNGCFA